MSNEEHPMRAVVTESYGAEPTMADVPMPGPGPGEVRVKVSSSSLNGFDFALARGYLKDLMEHRFPVVLGRDFAGTVDRVGEGVNELAPGAEVFGVVLTQPLNAGAFGEYLVVPEGHNIAPIPADVDHATAGALGLAGAAAVGSLDAVSVQHGETVLVSGAPGAETDHVRQFGAAHVVDRTQDLAAQVHQIAPDGLDAILHFAGDPFVLADLLVDGGRFASLLGVGPDQLADRAITATAVYASPHRALLEHLAAEVAAGRLRIPVQRSYTLSQVPQAFVDFAAGTRGKLAVTVD